MRFALTGRRCGNRLAPRFSFYFLARCARLFFGQQLQLQIAQRFTRRPKKPDALFAQPLLEQLNLGVLLLNREIGPMQFTTAANAASSISMRTCGSAAAIREALFYGSSEQYARDFYALLRYQLR